MTEFTTDYVRKFHAEDLEDFAESNDFDYTFAAEKLGEFMKEFGVERGRELAWEWAAEYGHEQPEWAYARVEDEKITPERQRIMAEHGMVPGVAYVMGADGWEGLYD